MAMPLEVIQASVFFSRQLADNQYVILVIFSFLPWLDLRISLSILAHRWLVPSVPRFPFSLKLVQELHSSSLKPWNFSNIDSTILCSRWFLLVIRKYYPVCFPMRNCIQNWSLLVDSSKALFIWFWHLFRRVYFSVFIHF